jgi:hypothetical protein
MNRNGWHTTDTPIYATSGNLSLVRRLAHGLTTYNGRKGLFADLITLQVF